MNIFLSHSGRDGQIAGALKAYLEAIFGAALEIVYSSDQTPGAGFVAGAKWRDEIDDAISAADLTLVLLTPNSMGRPWILWESGVAAGLSLARQDPDLLIPVTFNLSRDDVPSPMRDLHAVRGDRAAPNGIHRLLDRINRDLAAGGGDALSADAFSAAAETHTADYLAGVEDLLRISEPVEALLAKMLPDFPAEKLIGYWATSYEFVSGGETMYHADIARITCESDRWIAATNQEPAPRTEGHAHPFRNDIDAQLVRRHLIGHWKNTDDTRYFGTIHLALLAGDNVMQGHYTSFASDVEAGSKPWRWVRIEPDTVESADLGGLTLRDPREINALLRRHQKHAGCLKLDKLVETS